MISNTAAHLNQIVTILVLGCGVFMFFLHQITGRIDILDYKEHRSSALGFLLWLMWWASFLVVYFILPNHTKEVTPLILTILDIGDLSLLGFVICYCNGEEGFSWKRLGILPITLLFLILFYSITYPFFQRDPVRLSLWVLSPSVVLANVAIIMFGWSFFVRWEMIGLPLFLVSCVYALAQLPAYMAAFLFIPTSDADPTPVIAAQKFLKIGDVFSFLAVGKFLLAAYPVILFLSPKNNRPNLTIAKYWPNNERITIHPNIRRALLWGVTTISAGMLGALSTEIIKRFINELMTKPVP